MIVTETMLSHLPPVVQRYMTYSGVIGKAWINTVSLTYRGKFRLGKDKPWMPIYARQVYTTNPPGFQWKARFKLFGLPLMFGNDTYKNGQGRMFGKLAGLITLFDASDEKLIQGTMVRYLQEMAWFPTAYLSDYITWEAVDDHTADVIFTYAEKQVRGRMIFDDDGRLLTFIAERYQENNGTYNLHTWSTPMTDYQVFDGIKVPTTGYGVWQMPDADLTYITMKVSKLQYNVPVEF